jgi:two-component system chemotaxis sensor kinase CheA
VDNAQYAELFLTESRENVSAVNTALLELERDATGPSASASVDVIFRAVHTIKGMGATMGFATVAELAHELETVLDRIRRTELAIDAEVMDLLFRSADALESAVEAAVVGKDGHAATTDLVSELRALGVEEAYGVTWSVPAPKGKATLVRVRLAPNTPLRGVRAFIVVQSLAKLGELKAVVPSLDDLQADQFDDEFALRLKTKATPDEIERVARKAGDVADVRVGEHDTGSATRRSSSLKAVAVEPARPAPIEARRSGADRRLAPRSIRIDVRRLDALMNLVGELVIARGRLSQLADELGDLSLEETVSHSSRLITEIRDQITASRMVPVSQVFDRFPRIVRDAAKGVGKEIDFVVEGNDIELDRSMLDELGDSIVHLLRNAIDHGIEKSDARVAAGKPPTGRLVLSATRDRSAVVIKVSDDGRGIDRAKVLDKAKRDGIVDAKKTELDESELVRILARPGFSTADRVTGMSGRGVGVDAVYTRVRALGGAMDIKSAPGKGTTMMLRLPLTLAIVRAALARVANETYAIPLAHVSESIELEPEIIRTVKGNEVLLVRDEILPLLRLRSLVGLEAYTPASTIELEQVVVIDVGDRRAALVIDELTGQEEIVVKQYDAVRGGLPFFAGATILGDGTPSLIVDVSSLI